MNGAMAANKREKLKFFLENSEFYNQQIFEKHPDGYYALDLDGRYVQVNKECEELTEYTKEELYTLSYSDLISKDSLGMVNKCYEKVLLGNIQNYQCSIITKNRKEIDLEVTNVPIVVENEILGVYGIAKDVTKYNEQRCKLQESERLHRNLVEYSPDGIVIVSGDKLVYVNSEASLLLGTIDKYDVIGKTILPFIHEKSRNSIANCLKEAEAGSPSALVEEKIVQLTGKVVDVEVKAIPTIFEGQGAVYLIIRDISDRKLAHEFMLNSEKLSVAGQLAAGIAHEIRNPITAIKGFLQLMEGDGQHKKEFFSVISAEINRIELILSELLALAKPPLENFKHKNIRGILEHVVTLTRSQATLHNSHIQTIIKEKHLDVLCDENKLKQVFINFIKNAIEAMSEGGSITVTAESNGSDSVIIKIADEGPGIPKEMLNKIGKPFFTTKENGTGLGIMVSTEIIKHHNGEVRIDSDSKGTTISVVLPISK